MCSKHGVSGYPTLKAFKRGEKAFDYEGPRDAGKLDFVLFCAFFIFILIYEQQCCDATASASDLSQRLLK